MRHFPQAFSWIEVRLGTAPGAARSRSEADRYPLAAFSRYLSLQLPKSSWRGLLAADIRPRQAWCFEYVQVLAAPDVIDKRAGSVFLRVSCSRGLSPKSREVGRRERKADRTGPVDPAGNQCEVTQTFNCNVNALSGVSDRQTGPV